MRPFTSEVLARLACTFPRLLFGAALAALMSLTPAYSQTSQTFGRITEGTIPSNGLSAEFKRASRFTLSGSGTITELCAYLDGNGGVSGSQRFRFALYRDSNGVPGTRVLQTPEATIISETAARWYCMGVPLSPVASGSYWVAIHTAGTAGVIRDFGDGPSNWYGNADSFEDGASTTFGAGSSGTGTMSVYARYFPDSQLRNAGRTTVGTVPSNGMTADFKRGSSFMLPERGKLYAITAYVDGGGASTIVVGNFRYSIYSDANGVPDTKLYEGGNQGFRGTWPPQWVTENAYSAGPTLDAGRYWIVIHTGSTGGVIRNYGDGTPGNWYGNADAYADGASAQFGPGGAGNGTISAFVSYRPGTITTGELGRTEVGTKPSNGLSANFSRWSKFGLSDYSATLTGLNAYLDGLGGASGSQKVRMVIYGTYTDFKTVLYYYKIAESQEVTIAAGMPAQWVHFAVPSAPLDGVLPEYLVAIQSGDTAGVVRDYGDGRVDPDGNWYGTPDAFADGAIDIIPDNVPRGTGTMSVYATYSIPPP